MKGRCSKLTQAKHRRKKKKRREKQGRKLGRKIGKYQGREGQGGKEKEGEKRRKKGVAGEKGRADKVCNPKTSCAYLHGTITTNPPYFVVIARNNF